MPTQAAAPSAGGAWQLVRATVPLPYAQGAGRGAQLKTVPATARHDVGVATAATASETVLPSVAVTHAPIRPVAAPDAGRRGPATRLVATLKALEVAHLVPAGVEHGPTLVAAPRAGVPTALAVRRPPALAATASGFPVACDLAVPPRAGPIGPVAVAAPAQAGPRQEVGTRRTAARPVRRAAA